MREDRSQRDPRKQEDWQQDWQQRIAEANRCNIFCHCRRCDREWVASDYVACDCGSRSVEYICCWQFPDG